MSLWPLVKLDAVTVAKPGTRNPAVNPDQYFLYVDISSIDNSLKKIVDAKRILGAEAPSRARKIIRAGDIIVSTTRPNLNAVALVPNEFDGQICSTGFCVLRPTNEILADYLFHFVRSEGFVRCLSTSVSGALYPAVTDGQVRGLRIPLPPLTEQRRIVDILNHAAGIRRLRRQALDKTRALIPALFIDIFGDPENNPQQWPVVPLGELIIGGPQNGLYKHISAYGEGTPILRIDAFYDGIVTKLHSLRRLRLSSDEIDRYGLKENDIVINRVNSPEYLGKSAIIPMLSEPTVFESNMMRFSLDLKRTKPRYIIQYLQTAYIKQHILSNAKHAINQSSINQQDVKSMPVPVPPLDQQETFAARVAEVHSLITQQERHLAQAEALLQSLMARFFNGTETGDTSRSVYTMPVEDMEIPLAAEETEKYLK